jgi:hypothetical protein
MATPMTQRANIHPLPFDAVEILVIVFGVVLITGIAIIF